MKHLSFAALAGLATLTLSAPASATVNLNFTITGAFEASWTLPQNPTANDFGTFFIIRNVPLQISGGPAVVADMLFNEPQFNSGGFQAFRGTDALFRVVGQAAYFTRPNGSPTFQTGTFEMSSFLDPAGPVTLTISEVGGGTGGVIPEPATWAMLITGFGLVGSALRSRRRRFVVEA